MRNKARLSTQPAPPRGGIPAAAAAEASRPAPARRAIQKWFLIIVLAALAVRVVNGLFLLNPDNPLFNPTLQGRGVDMKDNLTQAGEILKNKGFPDSFFMHSPLYPYIIAAFYLVAPGQYLLLYVLQILAGALMCGLIYHLGRDAFDERTGRLAGLTAACYAPLLHNELIFQSDALAPFIVSALLAAATLYHHTRRPGLLAAVMGVLLGLGVGLRPNLALLGPGLAVWIFFTARRHPPRTRLASIAIIGTLSLLLISPYCYHNTRVLGHLTFTQGYMKDTIAISYGTESPGYFHYPQGHPDNPLRPFFSWDLLRLQLRKLRFIFSWYEFPDLYNYYLTGRLTPLIRWNPLTFGLVGPPALLGLLLAARRWRRLTLLYLAAAILLAGVLSFYFAARFRASLMPVLIVFAAHGALTTADAIRKKRRKAAGLCLGLLAVFAVFVNSLDTSRFHSIWYSDSMMGNGFLRLTAEHAKTPDEVPLALETAKRILWVKYPRYQLLGYQLLVQIYRELGQTDNQIRTYKLEEELKNKLLAQPAVDYDGNTFFPPTDSFGSYDPLQVLKTPEGILGATAAVYPPRK